MLLLLVLFSYQQSAIAGETSPEITPINHDQALAGPTLHAWELGEQSLINSEQALRNFSAQLDLFLNEPSATNLAQVQQEWRNSHQQWQQHALWMALAKKHSEAFAELQQRHFTIDARELQPGYLDAVQDYPFSGIVNDISIVINADNLRQQHGLTDSSEVSLGFHALELLLWSEQGQRKFNDFQPVAAINSEQNAAGLTTADLANNRRRALVRLITQLLTDDIQRLRQDWQNPQSAISQSYLQLAPETRLAWIQQTLVDVLANQLPQQLSQVNNSDRYTHHNQFAADTYASLITSLNSLEQLLLGGDKSLLDTILGPKKALEWQQQLRLQIATLNDISGDSGEAATAKIAQINTQLKQLANAITTSDLARE